MNSNKPLIVFVTVNDFAGTVNFTAEAIRSIGQWNCRVVSLQQHVYDYPHDLCVLVNSIPKPLTLQAARNLFPKASFVHIWNAPYRWEGFNYLRLPWKKVRSVTHSGTFYRTHHEDENKVLKRHYVRLVVQNPSYRYLDEIKSTFIPHAIPFHILNAIEPGSRIGGSIGCYPRCEVGPTSGYSDLEFLSSLVKDLEPWEWKLYLTEPSIWEERLFNLSRMQLYFEYMDELMGYWGQSAIEACALGIPTMSHWTDKALELAEGRITQPPIIRVTRRTLLSKLKRLTTKKILREEIGVVSKKWAEETYNYSRVGQEYTDFFNKML